MIYFVQAGAADGPVKIGKTKNLAARVKGLTRDTHQVLAVLATLDLPNKVEMRLHRLLKEHRIHGEWFRWCPEVAEVVSLAKAGRVPEFPYDHRSEELAIAAARRAAPGATHLAAYLKRRGVTVVEAAKQTGIDRSILQRIKTGSRPASKDAIRKLVAWSNGELDFAMFFEDEAA